MNGNLVRMALVAICLQFSCSAAHAVTWFDSNVRPDGACDTNTTANTNAYVPPTDDGTQVVSTSNSDGEVVGDVFDSGD